MPFDTFVKDTALRMEFADVLDEIPEMQKSASKSSTGGKAGMCLSPASSGTPSNERLRQAFAVVATGEQRTYGCMIVKKGVVTGG